MKKYIELIIELIIGIIFGLIFSLCLIGMMAGYDNIIEMFE